MNIFTIILVIYSSNVTYIIVISMDIITNYNILSSSSSIENITIQIICLILIDIAICYNIEIIIFYK